MSKQMQRTVAELVLLDDEGNREIDNLIREVVTETLQSDFSLKNEGKTYAYENGEWVEVDPATLEKPKLPNLLSLLVHRKSPFLNEFIDYVFDYYRKGGIFDIGATKKQIKEATFDHITQEMVRGETEFHGDTHDREMVKEILMKKFNLSIKKARERQVHRYLSGV